MLLTDGEDTASTVSFRHALDYAIASGVVVYAIALDIPVLEIESRRRLTQLAEGTGGRAFFVERASDLEAVYAGIAEELRSQYLLAFSPAEAGESARLGALEVEVHKAGMTARSVRNTLP